jgi:uncharacterized protein (TIGR02687 family)
MKILAVCAGSEPTLDSVVRHLLKEAADGRDDKITLIGRVGLEGFLWERLARVYGYTSETPGIRDFAIALFKAGWAAGVDGKADMSGDALVFLRSWKDSREFESCFEALSAEAARVLGIEEKLNGMDFRQVMELDDFRLIDSKIISDLTRAVAARTVYVGEVEQWVRTRRQSHWYSEFKHLYDAVEAAARFLHALDEAKLEMDTVADGVERYAHSWFRLDQLYRRFTFHARAAGQVSLTGDLAEQIENRYANTYLLTLGDRFQAVVDRPGKWGAPPVRSQKDFFEHWVQPFRRKDNKVCVIISDALRYETGEELLGLIRREDRFSAELEPALTMLPSYTQLGMAALLPHSQLAIADDDSGTVLVDGQSSSGTENRAGILQRALGGRADAVRAKDVLEMNGDDCRALVRDHDVLYVYHNRIDAIGHKRETEEQVFEAVAATLEELVRLVKKLTGANANNLLITADHGFIYQNRAIDESDFSGVEATGERILFQDRRFVLGHGLVETPGLRRFTAAELGLAGEVEVQIPKSVNRLRLRGSGSRFVHGGAALQEVVIPVLKINKKRQSDVSEVEVEILGSAGTTITTGQLTVTFYQTTAATDKTRPRVLRAGLYTEAGELISDAHERTFDSRSENSRERETPVTFMLTRKADETNGQEVILRLEEKHAGTSHYKLYKELRYRMRRSFTNDFDL